MIAYEFQGVQQETRTTPNGGTCTFAIGHIKDEEDSEPISAVAIQILDKDSNKVAEFALVPGTFQVLLDCIYEVFKNVPQET